MDDEFRDLEAELGRLRPAGPRREFLLRVERALAARGRPIRGWLWAAMPAAAMLAAAVVVETRWPAQPAATPHAPSPAAPAFKPVAFRDVLVDSRDDGYVVLADGRPARRLREAHIDTITWRDPRSAASLQWSVPREQIRIVPVSIQ